MYVVKGVMFVASFTAQHKCRTVNRLYVFARFRDQGVSLVGKIESGTVTSGQWVCAGSFLHIVVVFLLVYVD